MIVPYSEAHPVRRALTEERAWARFLEGTMSIAYKALERIEERDPADPVAVPALNELRLLFEAAP